MRLTAALVCIGFGCQLTVSAEPVHNAVQAGDVNELKQIISRSPDQIRLRDESGLFPLHLAANKGNMETLDLLLASGANPKATDPSGRTALHALLNTIGRPERDYVELVKTLIKYGTPVNAADRQGRVALHYAAIHGRTGIVELLIEHGAEVDRKDSDGFTALHHALNNAQRATANMLASRSESVDIFIAVGIGDEKTITKLLKSTNGSAANARDPDQFTPLHWAVRNQQAEAVKLLVNSKADPNAESFGGVRPLHLAIRTKNAELIKYLRSVGADLCQ